MDFVPLETAPLAPEISQIKAAPLAPEVTQITVPETPHSLSSKPSPRVSKDAIRTSLRASTVDAIFSTFFSITSGGILLSNFLVELDARPVVFGMLSSIPMVVNLIQPFGAYLSERSTSRFWYCLCIYGPSRLLWLILAIGITMASWGKINTHQLVVLTLLIVLMSNLLGALGGASWLSWMATLVPRRLRGRYFGLRNSVSSLTNLVCVPLAGLAVSTWPGGTLQGYGVVLLVGILSGLVSLGCQYFKVDVNPQVQNASPTRSSSKNAVLYNTIDKSNNTEEQLKNIELGKDATAGDSIWKNSNFLKFLLYFSSWMFAANLSLPFFNLYMLDTLNLDVRWVTLYGSLQAGANLLMLILWGKLADRIGNRPILLVIGMVAASVPLLWLGISTNLIDLWLWLPLIHIFIGGNWAALDLCNNNLQIEVTPAKNQSIYFAIASAIAGVSGALGTIIGGFIAQNPSFGGLSGLFIISAAFRLAAIVPLIFVQEGRGQSFSQMRQVWQGRKQVAQG
ncbi:MFS transporter [Mastigocladopsis repens]|uniref:MFS transporter n=1 Tax=Mastigocladopsis repens TaxID=221287 RepID=UPI0002FF7D17|nr:MFS transporter [Mastigocladopsis repens]